MMQSFADSVKGRARGQAGANTETTDADLSGVPVFVAEQTEGLDGAYLLTPGANVLMEDAAPVTTSGGALPGARTVSARVNVRTRLPDAATTGLPNGTLLDRVDSYGNPNGMFRLDRGVGVWR